MYDESLLKVDPSNGGDGGSSGDNGGSSGSNAGNGGSSGSGEAGSGEAGSGEAGSGEAGSGEAGSSGSNSVGGSSGTGGSGGSGNAGMGGSSGGLGGTGDTGGAGTGGTGGDSGGAGTGGTGGTGGDSGSAGMGGTGGTTAVACGNGRKVPTGPDLEDFDGMTQVLGWSAGDKTNQAGTTITPMVDMTIHPTNEETFALGPLATWAAANRPCMDGSAFTGIEFDLSGDVASLRFRISTPATIPVAEGGVCVNSSSCYGHYEADVTGKLAEGHVKVAFTSLVPAFGAPEAFDKSSLVGLIFMTLDQTKTKKFVIDNIKFY